MGVWAIFCHNCGKQISETDSFCCGCGYGNIGAQPVINTTFGDNVVDLRGHTSKSKPLEKSYKLITIAGVLMIPLLVLSIIVGRLYCDNTDSDYVFLGLLITSVPFVLISLLLIIPVRIKALQTERKIEKGLSIFIYVTTTLTIAIAMLCGFSPAFSEVGVMPVLMVFVFIIFAFVFVLACYMLSVQNGEEGLYCLLKAILIGAILSSPLAFVLGLIMRAIEIGMLVILLLFIVFIFGGGRLIIIKVKKGRY